MQLVLLEKSKRLHLDTPVIYDEVRVLTQDTHTTMLTSKSSYFIISFLH